MYKNRVKQYNDFIRHRFWRGGILKKQKKKWSKCVWSLLSFGVLFIMFCACRIFQNWCWKYFLTFFTDFLLTLNYKSTIYMVFFLDLAPNWLLDAFNIYLTYFSRKDLFKFLGDISYKYKKISQILAYFGYYVYIIFLPFSLRIQNFGLWELLSFVLLNNLRL